MPIESGPTTERIVRQGVFLAMCLVFFVLFLKDGFYGYAKENRQWAAEQLRQHGIEAKVQPDGRVTLDRLAEIDEQLRSAGERTTEEDLQEAFGEPLVIEPARWVYDEGGLRAVVYFDPEGKVVRVDTPSVQGESGESAAGGESRLTRERLAELEPGVSSRNMVRHLLGEPREQHDPTWWYVGPAVIVPFEIHSGVVVAVDVLRAKHSQTDILWQKAIAAVLGVVLIWAVVVFVGAIRVRVRVDEQGLTYKSKLVPWDEMNALDIDEYRRKGWVDLEYGSGQRLRLDSYYFAKFRPIVEAICERKGFEKPPFRKPGEKTTAAPAESADAESPESQQTGETRDKDT